MTGLEKSRKFLQYALEKAGSFEDYPFGPDVIVVKVRDKMFALLALRDGVAQMSLKCDPERAVDLRRQYSHIAPGYHLNKKHWNTLTLDGGLDDDLVQGLIDHSYMLVVRTLPRSKKPFGASEPSESK